ncbi:MAG: carboxylesterase/lipase family protein [Promethearchaeota archaeon]
MKRTEIIETKNGKIRGYIDEEKINIFKGVPYASPPIGELRFKYAVPPNSWTDVLDTIEFGPNAPQPPTMESTRFLFGEPREHSEADCLTLNIWTPSTDNKKRPVMFWIHGGNFLYGSAAQVSYDGAALAKNGNLVIVSIQYRMGPLGYLYSPDNLDEIHPNVGQFDQIAALKWVKNNISNFGGDPNNVTIFGESAGAYAVISLLAMPDAKGLFKRAIAESTPGYYNSDRKKGTAIFFKELGIKPGNISALQEVPLEKIINAEIKIIQWSAITKTGNPLIPAIDGKTLPKDPLEAIRDGLASEIPLIIGTNRSETKLWRAMFPTEDLDEKGLFNGMDSILGPLGQDENKIKNIINIYKRSREESPLSMGSGLQEIMDAFNTDIQFRIFTINLCEAQSKHQSKTFAYMFTFRSPLKSPIMKDELGACHGLEIAFAWGNLHQPEVDIFCGKGEEADKLSKQMMNCWIAFAKTGDPNHKGIPNWTSYDPEKRSTMILGKEVQLVEDPFGKERKVWKNII